MTEEMEIATKAVTVCTYKYDGTEHRRWRAQISLQRGSLIVLDAKFEEEIQHPLLGTIARETLSTEYYWLDHWYNIFRFVQPAGELRNYYCNVNLPPVFQKNVLSYVDLDIDILVWPDFSYTILDEDEFALNAVRFNYPAKVRRRSQEALEQLVTLIEKRNFPFTEFR
jgi:protein associated with RNAse G/E